VADVRLVQVTIPTGKRQAVLGALDDEGIDYVVSDETSGRDVTAVVSFPLPKNAVEPVLDRLREAGIDEESFTIVIAAETVVSRRFEQLRDRYEETEEEVERISRTELAAKADGHLPEFPVFFVMTAVSAVVATAGLLLDSPAVVVGSMVIAPLVGPAMATSVGTVVGETDLFRRGVKFQVLGGFIAVGAAAVFALVLRTTHVVPVEATELFRQAEIQERLVPDVLSLAVALGAGAVGALSLSTGVSTALVGVMIAAALVPPTAVVGIGLAWQRPEAVVGSTVLVFVNFLSINFSALAVLWQQGYRPERFLRFDEARSATLRRLAVLGAALLVLSAFLGGVTYSTYQTATFEDRTRTAVEATVATHEGLTLESVTMEYRGAPLFRHPSEVVVTVGYPLGTDPPPLAADVARRVDGIERWTPLGLVDGDDVDVEVRYVAVDGSD
jgi:uncharacterized hydrophobic protein (TIGR00341 family)